MSDVYDVTITQETVGEKWISADGDLCNVLRAGDDGSSLLLRRRRRLLGTAVDFRDDDVELVEQQPM